MLGVRSYRTYLVWRTFDRVLYTPSKFVKSASKLQATPAQMVRVFGPPDPTQTIAGSSGVFDFEDDNFDVFRIHDVRETAERISTYQLRRRHPMKTLRGKTEPFIPEAQFWDSHIPVAFKVTSSDQANVDAFLSWAKSKLRKDVDVKKVVLEKFGAIEGQYEYGKDYPLQTDLAFFTYHSVTWESQKKEEKKESKETKDKKEPKGKKDAKESKGKKESKPK